MSEKQIQYTDYIVIRIGCIRTHISVVRLDNNLIEVVILVYMNKKKRYLSILTKKDMWGHLGGHAGTHGGHCPR